MVYHESHDIQYIVPTLCAIVQITGFIDHWTCTCVFIVILSASTLVFYKYVVTVAIPTMANIL